MKYKLQKIDKESARFILENNIQNEGIKIVVNIDGELYTLAEDEQDNNHYFEIEVNIKEYTKQN